MSKVFESKTTEYCYIPILKNAHTWGTNIFQNYLDFEEKNYVPNTDKKYIIFLRNPVERWVSGVMEFMQSLHVDPVTKPYLSNSCKLDPLHLALLCTIVTFDAHTVRQVDYLREFYPKLYTRNIIYFYMDDNFSENVTSFLYKSFGLQLPTSKINVAKENRFKIHIEKQIINFLNENPKYKKNIELYFDRDYSFLNTCKFYKANRSNI